jgi:type II secretory pathway component GspD/PulD (secretin)
MDWRKIMKKIKLLAGIMFAGFALQQQILSQSTASPTTASNEVYGSMVSNVVKLSTGVDGNSANNGKNPPAPPANNETSSSTAASNVTLAPAASNSHPVAVVTSTASNATTTVINTTTVPADSNSHPAIVAITTVSNLNDASAGSNETAGVGMANSTDTNSQPDATTATNAAPEGSKIYFQDIPITSVIENLARQAGINYLLDPKIGYGQPDANGQVKAEPSLSIRWENITPEQALIALLDNYGLQLVTDPKTKISKITIKDPAAPPPLATSVYQLAYASVTNMESAVSTVLTDHRSKVVADSRTSQLIVQATDKEQTDVASLIKKLDKPTRQVLIETRFIEISSNPSTQKGVDWSGTLQGQSITFGNGTFSQVANSAISTVTSPGTATTTTPGARTITTTQPAGTTVSGNNVVNTIASSGSAVAYSTAGGFNPASGFLTANGLNVVLSFLNSSSDAQVVSTPRIVTLDNEEATIAVTRAFPIFQTTAGTQGSPGGSSITYSNVGIILEVTPHISANDYIWMKVNPSISTFFATVSKTVAGEINQADEFDSRNIDTQVLIPNANTLVMGGMVKDNPNANYTKVPILGDIPILGWAFRSETKSIDKQNLLIFITPTILKDSDFQPTATDFMNARPIKEKEPLDPNSAWDSGKPHDWTNPKNTDPTQIIINQKTTE